jgi:hypothetical protein
MKEWEHLFEMDSLLEEHNSSKLKKRDRKLD